MPRRPAFKKSATVTAPDSPETLWYDLAPRRKHQTLGGPQQHVLRRYFKEAVNKSDVALELPTGAGKTSVGLLIAEWHRRKSNRPVTYLSLTNQLAGQVLREASLLGITPADITGDRTSRKPSEVGRYKNADGVGITTYANLFNINPVVEASELIILDDAHGGEQAAADMWTARVFRSDQPDLYKELFSALGPAFTSRQRRSLTHRDDPSNAHIIHIYSDETVTSNLRMRSTMPKSTR